MTRGGGFAIAAIMCLLVAIATCAAAVAFMAPELYAAEGAVKRNPVSEALEGHEPSFDAKQEAEVVVPAEGTKTAPSIAKIYPPLAGQAAETATAPGQSSAAQPSSQPTDVAQETKQISQVPSTDVKQVSKRPSIFARAKCYPLSFPDILDINKCLEGSASLCVKTKKDFRAVLRRIALCCVKAIATANFGLIVLRVLRDVLIIALRVVFPMTSGKLLPLLIKMRRRFRKQENQATIIFTSRPCNETVDIYFPDFLGVADCIRPENFMCTHTGDIDLLPTQALTSLLLTAVCILKKLPFFKPFTIIWQLICSAFDFVHMTIGKTPNTFFYAFSEMGQLIFQCQIKNILPAGVKGHLQELKVFS